jgi:signal transduction histidine kinase
MQAQPFTEKQIALLETFTEQAVIAINYTCLFEEVQAKTRQLQESLEYQTATSDVLGVISPSPNQLQPVLDTIVATSGRLCCADYTMVFKLRNGKYHLAAAHGAEPDFVSFIKENPISPGLGTLVGRTALEKRTIYIEDALSDRAYKWREAAIRGNYRTTLGVPLLCGGEAIGVIALVSKEVKAFTDREVKLVETFADQAVIAIENTRLFEEVQARNRDLTALGEVGRAVSSTLDLKVVLKSIIDRAIDLTDTDGGSIFYYRQELGAFELGETSGLSDDVVARFRKLDILARETGLGEAIAGRQPLQLPDLTKRQSNPVRDASVEAGFRAALIVPLLGAEGPLGTLVLQRRTPGEFPQAVVSLMQSFADQSVIALENARLFEEIAQKSRELEIASQHKSQFLANMSHELRTPLAAMLGYAELLNEGIYGALPEKSTSIVTRIQSNGKHLLGLINAVLDISKIEAGQFKLNLAEYALGNVIETVRVATESLAAAKKLALETKITKDLPRGLGDEPRLTQVLLNLVGNAIKCTDAGEVRITAAVANGHFALSVSDTGPGIPPQERDKIFEKFHQIDNAITKAKGSTGLGLAIAKQIVKMHGGRIWVESTLGQGSTFRMELPVRATAAGDSQ